MTIFFFRFHLKSLQEQEFLLKIWQVNLIQKYSINVKRKIHIFFYEYLNFLYLLESE